MYTDIDRASIEALPPDWRDAALRFIGSVVANGGLHEIADGWVSTTHPRWPFEHLPVKSS